MLKELVEQLELEALLGKEGDDTYTLAFDNNLQISLRENQESGIRMFAKLASIPEENREEFLRYAMQANLFGKETGGNLLGADRDGKHLVMLRFLSLTVPFREFHDTLEDFVNYAESWSFETQEFASRGG